MYFSRWDQRFQALALQSSKSERSAWFASVCAYCDLYVLLWLQIARWNWSRVVLALSFARSTAPMAFALRYSVLPVIDSIMRLAFDKGVELFYNPFDPFLEETLSAEHEVGLQRSAISVQSFTHTKYFETEVQRHSKLKRKTLDS